MDNNVLNSDPLGRPYLLVGSNIRFLAENAIKHGHHVTTVDYYGDYDTRMLAPNRSILREGNREMSMLGLVRLAEGIPNKGVIYGPGFENDIVALRALQKLGPVLGCELKSARNARNPESIMRAAATWGFKYPETLLEKRSPTDSGRWLVKPLNSLGGGGVHFYSPTAPEPEGPYILQRHVPGIPSSVAVVSNGSDAAVLGIMSQIVGDKDFGASGFRYAGNIFPHPFADDISDKVTEIAEALTLEFDLKGLWGFDFIYDGAVTLLEINPRPTAGMGVIGACSFNDLLALHVESVTHSASERIIDFAPALRYTAHARVFSSVETTFLNAQEWISRGAKDVPESGSLIRAGEPVLTVCASAMRHHELMENLKTQAARLRAELAKSSAKAL